MKVDKNTRFRNERYGITYKCPNPYCPKLEEHNIWEDTLYCPICGVKLEWDNTKLILTVGDIITPIENCMNNFYKGRLYDITEKTSKGFIVDGVVELSEEIILEYFELFE